MKKIILIVCLLLLTGCGKTEYLCTYSDDSLTDEIRLTYDESRNITHIKQTTINKIEKDYYDYSLEYMNEACDSLNDIEGVNAVVTEMSSYQIKIVIDYNYEKMDAKTLYTLFSGEEYDEDADQEEIDEYIKVQTNVDEAVSNMLDKYTCVDLK